MKRHVLGHIGEGIFSFGTVDIRLKSDGCFFAFGVVRIAGVLGLVDAVKMAVEWDVLGSEAHQ
jgi:hypothetical protein